MVEAVRDGIKTSPEIAGEARIAPRYALYALHAARLLELVIDDADGQPQATPIGALAWQELRKGSAAERALLREAFSGSKTFSGLADTVLGVETPSKTNIADRLLQAQSVARIDGSSSGGHPPRVAPIPRAAGRRPSASIRRPGLERRDRVFYRRPHVRLSPPLSLATTVEARAPAVAETDEPQRVEKQPASRPPEPLPDEITPPLADVVAPTVDVKVAFEPVALTEDLAAPAEPLIRNNDLAYLRGQVESGGLVLLTGAGFSLGAMDIQGRPLPTGDEFAQELWRTCYPGEDYDSSSPLQDVLL